LRIRTSALMPADSINPDPRFDSFLREPRAQRSGRSASR
jgi:hypothetical protein